jgi:HEAT repeat protein
LKSREVLASIATSDGDPTLRYEAIRSLGSTNDPAYLPLLIKLVKSKDKNVQINAAQAAGSVGGPAAVRQLAAFLSSPDAQTREAATDGLGITHSREAVPILIENLIDSDTSVRQAAVIGLWLLTHHVALDGKEWADMSNLPSATIKDGYVGGNPTGVRTRSTVWPIAPRLVQSPNAFG